MAGRNLQDRGARRMELSNSQPIVVFCLKEEDMFRVVCSIVAVLALAACSQGSRSASPLAPGGLTGSSASEEGVAVSATGSAHRIRPLPDGELWVLTFNAVKSADGTVTGQAHVDRKDLDAAWDIDVTCLSVVGNRAWIAGIVRNARGAIPRDGTVSYFYVTDNGEGADSVLDRASGIRINDAAGQDNVFCTLRPTTLPDSEIAHGNVQVR